jgi:peptidoglycan hydrolase-like protein with peptidoglycan-binding domain
MKLTELLVASAALVSFSAIAAGEAKQRQDSQAQAGQSQSSERQAQGGQSQQMDQAMVKQAQEKLSAQGYDPGPVDGIFGPKTQAAVKKLQEDRSLKQSGQLDQETIATLGLDQAASASTGASGSAGAGGAPGSSDASSGASGSAGASSGASGSASGGEQSSSEKPTEKKY